MDLRKELTAIIATLVVLNLALAFGAIGLFVRMGPAIEKILEENVVSIVAAEEILMVLAEGGSAQVSEKDSRRVLLALEKAENNVTEEEERPILKALRAGWPRASEGESAMRKEFVLQVERLILVNRRAMEHVDERAKRLGSAGAWAAVLVGFSAFLLSLFVLGRLQRRLVVPLLEIHAVLNDSQGGSRLRRCRAVIDAPPEILQITHGINQLLDERMGKN